MANNNPFHFQGAGLPGVPPPPTTPQSNGMADGQGAAMPQPGAPAAPFALPPNVLATLSAIPPDQLVAVIQLIQSGQLALPPQVAATAPQQQQHAHTTAASVVQHPAATATETGMDKEDGELDEGAEAEMSQQPAFLRQPPTGPRKRSVSPKDRYNTQTRQRVSQQQDGSQYGQADTVPSGLSATSNSQQTATSSRARDGASAKRRGVDAGAAARNFVLQMHNHGYTFDQLAAEIPNKRALTRMYKTLGLPIVRQSPSAAPTPPTPLPQLDGAPAMTQEEVRKPSLTKRPPITKAAAPASREEYLAKLAAARTSKSKPATGAKVQPAQPGLPVSTQPSMPADANQTSAQASKVEPLATARVSEPATPVPTPKGKMPPNVQTELIKQRLAALKAKGAANKAAAADAAPKQATEAAPPATSNLQPTGLGSGLTPSKVSHVSAPSAPASAMPQPSQPPVASTLPTQPTFSPTHPTLNRSFSGLPGLFMAGSPPQPPPFQPAPNPPPAAASQQPSLQAVRPSAVASSSPAGSPAPLNLDRKRPTIMSAEIPAASALPKRPTFGNSAENSETTSLIIEVSDDEDEEEMDIDPEPPMPAFQFPGLPQRPSFASSVPGTTPISTPGGIAQAQIDAQIAAMKRQIAEKEAEARARKAGKAKPVTSDQASGMSSPAPAQPAEVPAATTNGAGAAGAENSAAGSTRSDSSTARQEEMAKLQAKLRAVNARLAGEEGEAAVGEVAESAAIPPQVERLATSAVCIEVEAETQQHQTTDVQDDVPAEEKVLAAVADSQVREVEDEAESSKAVAAADVVDADVQTNADEPMDIDSDFDSESESEDDSSVDGELNESVAVVQQTTQVSGQKSGDSSAQSGEEDEEVRAMVAAVAADGAPSSTEQEVLRQDIEVGEVMDEDDDYEPEAVDEAAHVALPLPADIGATSAGLQQPKSAGADGAKTNDVADDLAPELQHTNPQQVELAGEDDVASEQTKAYYRPYTSPLALFKDYRYRPDYLKNVSGGFKSLTYNHKIDAHVPLCQFEAQGGVCNDPECTGQHWRDMGLSDNDLLKLLGTARIPVRPGDKEGRARWNQGLAAVISRLREEEAAAAQGRGKVMADVEVIAERIAQYRREFVGDETKVLWLGLD